MLLIFNNRSSEIFLETFRNTLHKWSIKAEKFLLYMNFTDSFSGISISPDI